MSDEIYQYELGEWIVHSQYGVGQIEKVEKIPLGGDMQSKEQCFKVQTKDGVFWFPVQQEDNPRIRPITTKEKLLRSLKILQEKPEDTNAHHNIIKGRISKAQTDGSLKTIIKLVRDLTARRANKKHNILEDRALKLHTERLIKEWSLCTGLDETEARVQFNKMLQPRETQPT